MPARIDDLDTDDLIRRYNRGESLHAMSKRFGIDRYVIRRILHEGHIQPRSMAEAMRLTRITNLDEDKIVSRYNAGDSAHILAGAFGVSERVIYRVLRENNVKTRTLKEANNLIHDQLTLEQRQTRATQHTVVWEGRSYPTIPVARPDALHKKALTQQQTLAQQRPDERRILAALPTEWIDGQQIAVDCYNIDFTHGTVAMEVHSTRLHPFRSEKTVSRAIDLADRGWHVIYFWPNNGSTRNITERGIAELVTWAERLNCDPSPMRQYLVIRGGGELVTAGNFNLKERALIPTSIDVY